MHVERPRHRATLRRGDRLEPTRPLLASRKFGLLPLAIRENTHKIWFVDWPHAKLTWFGSEATLGFWQAVVIWFLTTATLDGHDALGRSTMTASTVTARAAAPRPKVIFWVRLKRLRRALCRP